MTRSTEERIRELAHDVPPVHRIPALRWVVAILGLLWIPIGGTILAANGIRSDLIELISGGSQYASILFGLVFLAVGATIAALALCVPGREAAERAGLVLAALGLLAGVGFGGAFLLDRGAARPFFLGTDLHCLLIAAAIATAPAYGIAWFARYAVTGRPYWTGAVGILGAVALGSATVHISCPLSGAEHWFYAHAMAPIAALAVGLLPLRWLTRRRSISH